MTAKPETPKRPHIALHEVKSSQVKSVGFDHGTNTLAVQFTRGSGAIYHYPGVTKEQYEAFVKAESIGVHFGKHIKVNHKGETRSFTKFDAEKAPA